jgi:NADH-quinone oxidoreductase subunit E
MSLAEVLNRFPKQKEYLIEILLEYQRQKSTHSFTESELKEVAKYLNIPESRVCSVVAFYSFFSTQPKGHYVIQVCHDLPCHLNDHFDLLASLTTLLEINIGETTKDGLFTLEHTSCLGHCDKSPAIRVNEKIYGNLNLDKLKAIIAECKENGHD